MSFIRNQMKWAALLTGALFGAALLGGCGADQAQIPPQGENAALKIGVTPGPHADIMEIVKKKAASDSLKIDIVEFSDYTQPNAALHNGEIDVNSYQHQPFLDAQVKDCAYQIETLAKTILFPMGVYSEKIQSLKDVKNGAVVSIPNDPSNGGRALLLLEKAGLLSLQRNAGLSATIADIVDNPKHLQIEELEAAQIPLSLRDVEFAVINANYAVSAGLIPMRDALFLEDGSSPYVHLLVVRSQDKDRPVFQALIRAYHSDEVKQYVEAHLQGAGIAAW